MWWNDVYGALVYSPNYLLCTTGSLFSVIVCKIVAFMFGSYDVIQCLWWSGTVMWGPRSWDGWLIQFLDSSWLDTLIQKENQHPYWLLWSSQSVMMLIRDPNSSQFIVQLGLNQTITVAWGRSKEPQTEQTQICKCWLLVVWFCFLDAARWCMLLVS